MSDQIRDNCAECGRTFIGKRADAKTCSDRCRQARRRRARSGALRDDGE